MTNEPLSRSRRLARRAAALAASLLATGVGHVLIGRWKRGACLSGALMLLAFSLPLTRLPGLVAFVLLFLAIQLDVSIAPMAPRPKGARLIVLLGIFVGALLVWRFGMRAYYLEAFRLPSGSMAPTLQPGDLVFVAKYRTMPRRGELVVYADPSTPHLDFAKRVVALGGDRLVMKRGALYVNSQPAKAAGSAACASSKPDEMAAAELADNVTCVEEELDGFRYAVLRTPDVADDFPMDDAEYVVPQGTVFVLGDNRENSHDSRRSGPIPLELVKGTVLFRWLSTKDGTIDWGRIGTNLDRGE